jgi:hypothetical protein
MVRLILILTVALATTVSISLGQDDNANTATDHKEGQTVVAKKFVPSSKILSGLKKMNEDIASDLTPQAQSYFIEPPQPTTSTVKPIFTRRKTHRPITSLAEKNRKGPSPSTSDDPDNVTDPKPVNPFSQIVTTGFAKKRPSGQRSRNGAEASSSSNSPDLNSNYPEVNEIRTTTEGQPISSSSVAPEETTPSREISRRRKNKPLSLGSGSGAVIAAKPQIRIDRPNQFTSSRRNRIGGQGLRTTLPASSTTTSSALPIENNSNSNADDGQFSSQGTTATTASSAATPIARPGFRGGRQGGGFTLRPKPTLAPAALSGNENSPKKSFRRKTKPTTETSVSTVSASESRGSETESSPAPEVNYEVPTGRKIPAGLQRRPGFGSRAKLQPDTIVIADPPVDLLPKNYVVDNVRPRGRGSPRAQQQVQDSVHESSDIVSTSVLTPDGDDTVVVSADDAPDSPSADPASADPNYRPRNLSNRKSNPLDKLTNRQAAARRFLTPKENNKTSGSAATAAPVIQSQTSPLKKTPFSLQNLRNRRRGPGGVTTTTTTTTTEVAPAAVNDGDNPDGQDPAGNPDEVGKVDTVGGDAEKTSDAIENGVEAPEEEVPPPPPTLPGRRRPGFPGGRKSLVPRVPNTKPRSVATTTTEKPVQAETTPAPTCEDGKRYNKILRKCIPSFAPRSG